MAEVRLHARLVKPDFWHDAKVASWPVASRLFYIGLWCVADDAGWLPWLPDEIGAWLYPYQGAARRRLDIARMAQPLVDGGSLIILDCGCARIPTLPKHQTTGGYKSFTYRDRHQTAHSVSIRTDTDTSGRIRQSGMERNGMEKETIESPRKGRRGGALQPLAEVLAAHGLRPDIVKDPEP